MLSIIRPELLEEPIAYDDPVPGTQCYFMETGTGSPDLRRG